MENRRTSLGNSQSLRRGYQKAMMTKMSWGNMMVLIFWGDLSAWSTVNMAGKSIVLLHLSPSQSGKCFPAKYPKNFILHQSALRLNRMNYANWRCLMYMKKYPIMDKNVSVPDGWWRSKVKESRHALWQEDSRKGTQYHLILRLLPKLLLGLFWHWHRAMPGELSLQISNQPFTRSSDRPWGLYQATEGSQFWTWRNMEIEEMSLRVERWSSDVLSLCSEENHWIRMSCVYNGSITVLLHR